MLDFIVKIIYNISMITIDDIKRLQLLELTFIQIRRINNAETSCKNVLLLIGQRTFGIMFFLNYVIGLTKNFWYKHRTVHTCFF